MGYKVYGMENSIPVQIPFPQSPAEPSDNSASHSSGNGYKATTIYVTNFIPPANGASVGSFGRGDLYHMS